jgi:hypothetical protein
MFVHMTELSVDLFQTNPEPVSALMVEVEQRKLGLPQFQRSFIWAPANTASLLSSMMARYPAGALLTWRHSNAPLQAREIEGAPSLVDGAGPERLILDGQQRVTALYRALQQKTEESYFVYLGALLDVDAFEIRPHESIVWDNVVKARELTAAERRALTRAKNPSEPEHHSRDWQYENLAFPIGENFDDWIDGLIDTVENPDERKRRRDVLRLVRDTYLTQLQNYRFPVITLTDAASLAAVCNVFEKLNSNSIRLGPYEILTAKFFKDNVDLRARWETALAENAVLKDPAAANDHAGFSIDPYLVLQIITMVQHQSPQRRAVLDKLTAQDVADRWDEVVLALRRVIEWLRGSCGVIHRDLLPYQAMLIPITGAWLHRETLSGAKKADALSKISNYFWASTFTTNFDQGGASQAEKDYRDLVGWLDAREVDGVPIVPEANSVLKIKADDLLTATVRKKALMQGMMALTVKSGAKDFHKGEILTPSTYVSSNVNSHHLFPKARLADKEESSRIDPQGFSGELILNRALIDAETNKRIGAKKPSAYLAEMEAAGADVTSLLESHLCPVDDLVADSYKDFLLARLAVMVDRIEAETGVAVDPLTETYDELEESELGEDAGSVGSEFES